MLHIDIKSKGKACLSWLEKQYQNRVLLLIGALLYCFVIFLFLIENFVIWKLDPKHATVACM